MIRRRYCVPIVVRCSCWIGSFVAALVVLEAISFAVSRPIVVPAIEHIVGPICHHLPQRTIQLARPLPVCARCTGLYLGWLIGAVGARSLTLKHRAREPRNRREAAWLVAGSLYVVAVIQPPLEAIGFVESSNSMRLVLGLPLGLVPAAALEAAKREVVRLWPGKAL